MVLLVEVEEGHHPLVEEVEEHPQVEEEEVGDLHRVEAVHQREEEEVVEVLLLVAEEEVGQVQSLVQEVVEVGLEQVQEELEEFQKA